MITQDQYEAAVRSLASQTVQQAVLDNMLENRAILAKFGIDTPLKTAHFLSQTAHESDGFKATVENLRYTTAARIRQTWPTRFPDETAAAPYVNNPEALANAVYANRMGNGSAQSGDGFRYRGRGLLQLTGKTNYTAVGRLTGLPLDEQPELAGASSNCLLVACGAWKYIGAADLVETASVETYTRKVNGGLVGLEDRKARFEIAKKSLGI